MKRTVKHVAVLAVFLMTAASAGAFTIGFETSEGYTEGNLTGQPSGTRWSGTSNLMFVASDVGGQFAQAAAPNVSSTIAAYRNIAYTPQATDFGGDSAPTEANFTGQLSYSFDLAYHSSLFTSGSSAWFFRFGENAVELFFNQNGTLTFRSSGSMYLAQNDSGSNFNIADTGADTFVNINGVMDYGTGTYTLWVNDVQQEVSGSEDIAFQNATAALTRGFYIRLQSNESPATTTEYVQIQMDNIAVDVVPEPATLSLLGLGGLALLRRRR